MGNTTDKAFFIRRYRQADQDEVLRVWLKESLQSHSFIPAEFWKGYLDTLKYQYLPHGKTFIAERDGRIVGFISLIGNYVGALFVASEFQRQGIGRALLNFAHKSTGSLFVDVYKENIRALDFYTKFGFIIRREKIQQETGQPLITMYI
ncbi:MAG: putative N-acetyltransferase YjaB [Candidatus Dichloromethanomonas elyunquensis]|nr:MAG: putative N-acetyltransferase YjaB [Candidatus Dichloromethanomonas elyunquensis]